MSNAGSGARESEARRRDAEAAHARALADDLRGIHALEAQLQARKARVLAEAYALAETQRARITSTASRERDIPLRSIAAELGVAVRMNDRTMQAHLYDAHRLVTDFSGTLGALEAGEISRGHVSAILEAGAAIEDADARALFEQTVLDFAVDTTAAHTRAYAKMQAEVHNPRTLQERYDIAVQDRRTWITDLDDGMAQLSLIAPAALIHGIHDRTTRQAKAIKAVERGDEPDAVVDGRTIDQIRADLVCDMLLTGSPVFDPTMDASPGGLGAIRATVQITVPVTTLTGVTASGAELDGRAPVDPETARRLAGGAPGWDRVMTHPVTGVVLAVDRYQPLTIQRRFLNARDQHCRFPGCRQPARRCDHDHTVDWAHGGPTDIRNLACLCKRHHMLKHATNWTVRQLPGGMLEWTSPGGSSHLDRPTPRVVFVPSDDSETEPAPW